MTESPQKIRAALRGNRPLKEVAEQYCSLEEVGDAAREDIFAVYRHLSNLLSSDVHVKAALALCIAGINSEILGHGRCLTLKDQGGIDSDYLMTNSERQARIDLLTM